MKLSNHPTSNVYQKQEGLNLLDSIDRRFFWLCADYEKYAIIFFNTFFNVFLFTQFTLSNFPYS